MKITYARCLAVSLLAMGIAAAQPAGRALGVVQAIDPANGEVVIIPLPSKGAKPLTIGVGAKTVVRCYAPDSVKFIDAKPGTLAEIKKGDQVRALGEKSPDGARYPAEEVVSGTFRNVA